jgi:gluconolactonase
MEQIATGFEWSEGPLWLADRRALLFSDIPRNSVYMWTDEGKLSLFLKPSGYTGSEQFTGQEPGSNGLERSRDGRLILCQHGDRRVARLAEDGKSFETLADRYEGKRLNSPNDLTFKSNGDLYFTDPPYGLPRNVDDPGRELDFQGVYRLSVDGKLTLLTRELSRPNGIAFSPDEKTLYVANSDPEKAIWMAFPVLDDGTIGEGKVLFDATEWVGKEKGLPDGMTVAATGHIFATGPGGVLIFAPDGKHLGTLKTGEATANCTLGGADGSTLYITADMHLLRIPTLARAITR